ncbi:S-layer homology domain-containing protein [Paenibacillus plantarum]|nr:S-layer homology domain-containing protein [Paenibacillus plantarum]
MKKTIKTFTLTAATALLSLSLVGQSFAATSSFTDLNNIASKDKIIALQESGIVGGITSTLFSPQEKITAAQSVQLLVNALGLNLDLVRFVKEPKASDYITNASNDAWYAQALIVAAVNNVDLPKDLNPDKKLTREEFTHQLVRAIEVSKNLPLINPLVVDIKDGDQLTVDYSGSIQRGLKYGIITLNTDGTFNPKAEITRAEAAEEVYNALDYLKTHQAPVTSNDPISAAQGVQLITDALGKLGTDIKIKIDPDAKMTRESFTYLLIHTFQTSEKLPMIKLNPVEIKDNDKIDLSNVGAIQTALALDIVELNADGTFHPQDGITLTDATEIATQAVKAVEGLKK